MIAALLLVCCQVDLEARDTARRAWLPAVADPQLARDLASPDLALYTRTDMPPAFQFEAGLPNDGLKWPGYNMAPPGLDPTGNYFEFPWRDPAGSLDGPPPAIEALRGWLLPARQDGSRWPVVWWSEPQPQPRSVVNPPQERIAWAFPVGTLFFELLINTEGEPTAFLLRTRRRAVDHWDPDELAPYVEAGELEAAVSAAGGTLRRGATVEVRLADRHPVRSIEERGVVEQLGDWPPETRRRLLVGRVWRSTAGHEWRPGVQAPMGGLGPRRFAPVFEVSPESCARCHRSSNRPVSFFQLGRDWYGNVSGDDQILSWHPFALEAIATRGEGRPVRLRQDLIEWGWLERYDPRRHPAERYRPIAGETGPP